MAVRLLPPRTPCCDRIVVWDEAEYVLPCLVGEYDLGIPMNSAPSFILGCQDFMRHHNANEHGQDVSVNLRALYGVMEAHALVGRHARVLPTPPPHLRRCQCMGVIDTPDQILRTQCRLAADRGLVCSPCYRHCLVRMTEGGMVTDHSAPLTVQRGRFN